MDARVGDYIEKKDKEIAALKDESADQLRLDAERWRTVLQVVSDTQPNSNTPHNWEQWELPLFKVPGPFASEADEFTAAVDLIRTQKAPG